MGKNIAFRSLKNSGTFTITYTTTVAIDEHNDDRIERAFSKFRQKRQTSTILLKESDKSLREKKFFTGESFFFEKSYLPLVLPK